MNSPLKWPGGKHYLAKRLWEIASKVPHKHRVEAYCGSCAFTLATDPEGYSEVVNDLNGPLTNFWDVLQCQIWFHEFQRLCSVTPFSEVAWERSGYGITEWPDKISRAWAFFVQCRQSLGGATRSFAPLSKKRTRRGMNEQAAAWLSSIDGLAEVHNRLKRVVVLRRKAISVIQTQDSPDTLLYLDPPYTHDSRESTKLYGNLEMTPLDHAELCDTVSQCQGKVMLSGYDNQTYWEKLGDWNVHRFDLPNNMASGKKKRRMTECVWCNF